MAKKINELKEGESLLSTYKKSPHTKQKKQRPLDYLRFSPALAEITAIQGFPISNCSFLLGFSNTGKTTALLEGIVAAQNQSILPIILITEKKFSFAHLKEMGFKCELVDVTDEDSGEVSQAWDGEFIYKDDFETSNEIYEYMNNCIEDTKNGKLPYNICFFIDSLNKLPCKMSFEKAFEGGGGTMHNAKTHTELFGGIIEPKITASKYEEKYPHSISMVAILRGYPNTDGMGVITPRGGNVFKYDAGLTFLFGGKTAAATQEITYTLDGDKVNIGVITTARLLKNHLTGLSKEGKVAVMLHGFCDTENVDQYKKDNKKAIQRYFSSKIEVIKDNEE